MKSIIFCLFSICSLLAMPSYAVQADIKWTNTSHYTDIEPGSGTRKSTLHGVQKALDSAFLNMAKQLPEGYEFIAEITNVDLAGRVNPPQLNTPVFLTTRVLTQNYFPAITLNYVLKDANGKVVLSKNNFIIKDLDFLSNNNVTSSSAYFFEVQMVRNWFQNTIISTVN